MRCQFCDKDPSPLSWRKTVVATVGHDEMPALRQHLACAHVANLASIPESLLPEGRRTRPPSNGVIGNSRHFAMLVQQAVRDHDNHPRSFRLKNVSVPD
jgi:hypothetical protein